MALYKPGKHIYWTEFVLNGQRFRKSLGTSVRRIAERREKRVIADAKGGRIQPKASSPAERSVQRSLAVRRSHADKAVKRSVLRENRRHAKDSEIQKTRIEAIRAGARTEDALKAYSDRSLSLWAADRLGSDGLTYRQRNSRAVRLGKWATKRMQRRRSMEMKARCEDPQFLQMRNLRSLAAAVERARAAGILSPGIPRRGGRPPGVTKKTKWRNTRIAALLRLGLWERKNFKLIFPDSHDPESADANARAHLSKHREAIVRLRNTLTDDQARAVIAEHVPESLS